MSNRGQNICAGVGCALIYVAILLLVEVARPDGGIPENMVIAFLICAGIFAVVATILVIQDFPWL